MADPFIEGDGGDLIQKEMQRLRQENRELRLTNTNLRARLALITPTASVSGDGPHSHTVAATTTFETEARDRPQSETGSGQSGAAETAAGHGAGATRADAPARRPRSSNSNSSSAALAVSAGASVQVSAARIQEAVQQVKKELHGELEKMRQTTEAEKAEKAQLKKEFELFVSTTCEREAAYQLVYTGLFRELEEQKSLVQVAQAQLEEQRLQSLKMREQLEAAVAAASTNARAAGTGTAHRETTKGASAVQADSSDPVAEEEESTEEASATAPAAKRQRVMEVTQAEKLEQSATAPRRLTQKSMRDVDWTTLAGSLNVSAPSQPVTVQGTEATSIAASSELESTGPRTLKIIAGGAALRRPSRTYTKRTRDGTASESSTLAKTHRVSLQTAVTTLHVPAAPVFAAATSNNATREHDEAPSTANAAGKASKASSSQSHTTSAVTAAKSSQGGSGGGASTTHERSPAVDALWRLLAQHTEATQGFLPLWQHLDVLRGADRHTALDVLVSLLVHLLGPDTATTSATPANESPAASSSSAAPSLPASVAASSLPRAFTAAHTSVAVVATAVRLLAVQLDSATQQQQQHQQLSRGSVDVLLESKNLLGCLFYRLCVAALRRWQRAECAADALERWTTAVHHLYGFQPGLLRLMQYTNTAAAYHRTRLQPSWITYTAQGVFAQCFTTTTTSSSSSAEAAVARWCELCDSLGWSPHALPLDRIETAAARCVAMTRVSQGPFTDACAEEALLSLRLVVLYKGFDHMEQTAKLLEQPGVLPMAVTKEIYAELVSLAVRDRVPFHSHDALHHALRLLKEYVLEVAPERCTSAEHFVSAPRRSHILAALALLRVDASTPSNSGGSDGSTAAAADVVSEGRKAVLQWLMAQKTALEMVHHSRAFAADRRVLLRDTVLGRALMDEVK